MKMDVRTAVALCLLTITATAAAQTPPQEQTVPAPQQGGPPTPAPSQSTAPAPAAQPTPPASNAQQNSRAWSRQSDTPNATNAAPQSPPPPQYQYSPPSSPPPPPPAHAPDEWSHSESSYYEGNSGFSYRPFRFHIDAGGTITQRSNSQLLNNGWNAGLGFSWYPTSHLPLGIRVDGSYSEFGGRQPLLDQATATYGNRVDSATQKMWGGDVDLELDTHLSPNVRMYLLAGGGWYRQQTTYHQRNYYAGLLCDWWGCAQGYYGVDTIVARNTTDWHFAKNAGIGFEFAMSPQTSFFIEARYMRLNPKEGTSDFLPIRAGLRF